MPKTTKYPSTPEIDSMPVTRQRKLQLRANLAGKCGVCFVNDVACGKAKCHSCNKKSIAYQASRRNSKVPQPHRAKKQEIIDTLNSLPSSDLECMNKLNAIADKFGCHVRYMTYLRRRVLGIKLKAGRPKNEKDTTQTTIA